MTANPTSDTPPPTPSASGGKLALAIVSVCVGVLSCPGAIIPLCGCPVSLVGLICGIIPLVRPPTDEKRGLVKGLALTGTVLSGIGFLLTVVNAILGAYLGATGRHLLIQP